jgi:hypothetical protein
MTICAAEAFFTPFSASTVVDPDIWETMADAECSVLLWKEVTPILSVATSLFTLLIIDGRLIIAAILLPYLGSSKSFRRSEGTPFLHRY